MNKVLEIRSLSVGNYLKRNGVVVTIDARSIFDVWDNEGIKKLGYEPIPITILWLKRFGFVFENLSHEPIIKDQIHRKAVRGYGLKAFEIDVNMNTNKFTLGFVDGELIEYNFVHELQNLYYLLRDSELSWDGL